MCVVKSLNPTLYVLVIRLHSGRFDLQGPNLLQTVYTGTVSSANKDCFDYVILHVFYVGASWFVGSCRCFFGREVELFSCVGAIVGSGCFRLLCVLTNK